jgi:ectoine hydroxylase-related dioxygenase (phytanoyl-CoA dioxygenase family)
MSKFIYEFEKYLCNLSNINHTIDKYGVAIIPILDEKECEEMIKYKWELLEYLTSNFLIPIDRNNKETYKQIENLYPSHRMLLKHWKVGHSKLAWFIRQNPKVINIFKSIWNEDDLITSFDACSIFILNKSVRENNSWFHVDQSYTRNNFECVQGWINGYDTDEGDATLIILENSNKFHKMFQEYFKIKNKKDWYKLTTDEISFYIKNGCSIKAIKCPKGHAVLWDSRTVHYGNPIQKVDKYNYRCVVYICMVPRNFANKKQLEKRKKIFEECRMTSHWPHNPIYISKYPQTYGKPLMNIKDIEIEDIKSFINNDGYKLI